jgi:hypothetical protein
VMISVRLGVGFMVMRNSLLDYQHLVISKRLMLSSTKA